MLSVHVNYWAVIAAAVVNMVVGAIWYHPAVFGKPWAKYLGKKMDAMQANATAGYSVSTIGAVIQAFILANLVRDMGLTTGVRGAFFGLLLWLGFVAVTMAPDTVFSGRPWNLWKLNSGYYLVVLLINGALLAVWR